jgi:hypothetical protein
MIDLRPFVESVRAIVARHRLDAPGRYRRYTIAGTDETGAPCELGANPYGCADAANLLYTIGDLPSDPEERAGWVASLRGLQDPATGLFRERTHHEIHTTAHCLGALELFDARPAHPLAALAPLRDPDRLAAFLDGLDWKGAPWSEAHRGAGLWAALENAGESDAAFSESYFAWLSAEVDPATGLLRRGCVDPSPAGGVFPHLAGSFHYLFDFEHAKQPWPHAAALVDTCLAIRATGVFPLARHVWFADVDWVYCLSRGLRQSDHREAEARRALDAFAAEYASFLLGLDPERDEGLDDLHRLLGAVCALAELQRAAPGVLASDPPLRLVLDRRPFI